MPKHTLFTLKNLEWKRSDFVLEILLISILIVPFLSIVDVLWMFSPNAVREWNTIHTPLAIKFLKDILLVLLLVVLILKKRNYSSWSRCSFAFITVILIFSIARAYVYQIPSLVILSGIRWFLPLFLFPLFDQYKTKKEDMIKLYERYRLIIFAALPLQILQILFSERWNIREGFIYSRANGFYPQPQPMSLFALFFLIIVFEVVPEKRKTINYAITFISIALTKSAAGVLGIASLFFIKATNKYKIIIGLMTLFTIMGFPYITGRIDYWESPLQRFVILKDVKLDKTLFGSYSNACSTIQKIVPEIKICQIPDSFATSSLGNLGLISGVLMMLVLFYSIYRSKKYYLLPIFLLFLISANLTEYFPLNFLFPFIIGFKWREEADQT